MAIPDGKLYDDGVMGAGAVAGTGPTTINTEKAGAAVGFMGLNAAQSAGGVNVNNLFTQSQTTTTNNWTCSCGTVNTGNFCSNCGKKKEDGSWTCSCGTVNTGNFCSNCGSKKPQ